MLAGEDAEESGTSVAEEAGSPSDGGSNAFERN